MIKRFTFIKTLIVAVGLTMGVDVWGENVELDPVGVFTWTNVPKISYDAEATSWNINQGGVSGGKIGRYEGPYAIVKFDASSILAEKTLLSATLDFDITAGANNSSMNIAQLNDASFNPATVTTETFDATATQFQDGDWSTKNATTHFSYDVKDRVAASNVIAFAIYTYTAREQTLKNVKLKVQYSTGEVSKYSYSLTATTEGDAQLKVLASGEEYETNDVTAYFPYMLYNEGSLYTTTQTPYSVTLTKDNATSKVVYAEANSNIVFFMEGEAAEVNSGTNESYSGGKSGHAAGNKTVQLTILTPGKYQATIYLTANGNRSLVVRNTANSDVNTNTVVSLPIDKNSTAGVYTSEEFIITEDTNIGFSGYTTGEKTNQSADIDYIYITKTGDVPTTVSKSISAAGFATFCSEYALDFSTVEGLKAYIAKNDGEGNISFEQVASVPANTGVLLKGEAKSYDIPVVASSATDVSGNVLVGVLADTEAAAGSFVLMASPSVAFYKAKSAFTVGANTAYIAAAATVRDIINIDGEATVIKAIATEQGQNDIYNMAGQRVEKAQKGLYIIGGKKAIVK